MAKVDLSSMALSDVSLIRLLTKGSAKKEYLFTSSTDFEAEEVIQEGEEKPLIIKGVLRANKPAKDTLLGHDIKFFFNNIFANYRRKIFFKFTIFSCFYLLQKYYVCFKVEK